jgi:hypothetical protein
VFGGKHFGKSGREIGADQIEIRPAFDPEVRKRRMRRADLVRHKRADPLPEIVPFVPAVLIDQAFGVTQESERIIHEAVEIHFRQDLALFGPAVSASQENGVDRTRGCAADTLNILENFLFLEDGQRTDIRDALYATPFEHEISKLCHGMRFRI